MSILGMIAALIIGLGSGFGFFLLACFVTLWVKGELKEERGRDR